MDLLADPDNPDHARAAATAASSGKGAKRQRLEILRGISGTFRPGVLTALVRPSTSFCFLLTACGSALHCMDRFCLGIAKRHRSCASSHQK